jgi:hypothetical protein
MIHSLAPTRHTTHSNRNVNMMAGMHVGTGWCVCARWWVVGVGLFINTIDAVAGRASLLRLEPLHLHTRGHPRPQWVVARLGAQHWSDTPSFPSVCSFKLVDKRVSLQKSWRDFAAQHRPGREAQGRSRGRAVLIARWPNRVSASELEITSRLGWSLRGWSAWC